MAEVKIYTTPFCIYCLRAKALLNEKKVAFQEINVSGKPDMRHWLAGITGRKTVPQIFINGKPVGGFDDIADLDRRGRLDALLNASA